MADDFFGPASDLAVTTRPTLTPTMPRTGGAKTWFAPCSSPDAEDGTAISAEWGNLLAGNLEAVRAAAGVGPGDATPGGDDALLKSILALIASAFTADTAFLRKTGGTMTGLLAAPAGFRTGVKLVTADTTLGTADLGGLVEITATTTVTTTLPTSVGIAGALVTLWNASAVSQTIGRVAGTFVGPGMFGATTISLPAGAATVVISDGADWVRVATEEVVAGPDLSGYLPLTGGSLTGFLTLHAAPTAAMHAANKGYVDGLFLPAAGAVGSIASFIALTTTLPTAPPGSSGTWIVCHSQSGQVLDPATATITAGYYVTMQRIA